MSVPALSDIDVVFDAAQTLLRYASAAVDETRGGHIDFQEVWQGLPSYDCVPALFVHLGGSAVADTYPLQPPLQPSQRIAYGEMVDMVQFTITVLRCVPVIEVQQQSILLPSPGLITAAARDGYADLWAIWNYLKNAHRAGDLFQTPSGRREFAFDPAIPIRTSGGAGGWEIGVRVQIPGYSAYPGPPS